MVGTHTCMFQLKYFSELIFDGRFNKIFLRFSVLLYMFSIFALIYSRFPEVYHSGI